MGEEAAHGPAATVPPSEQPTSASHDLPYSPALEAFMGEGWANRPSLAEPIAPSAYTAKRREALSAAFPGEALVIPTGHPKVRSNDVTYPFRPGTDYFYLTGDPDPHGVLVLLPAGAGHDAVLLRHPIRPRSEDPAFYRDRQGEFWEGRRRTLSEAAASFGVECRPLAELEDRVRGHAASLRVLPGVDPELASRLGGHDEGRDRELAAVCAEQRLVKDEFEVSQLAEAVAITARGFDDIVRRVSADAAAGSPTSERLVEGLFACRARAEGNGVGYPVIAAAGPHAAVLHWTRADGAVGPGDLLLVDAGAETDWLYTADITRTVPASGRFSPEQRTVYEVVLAAQQAGLAAVRPGSAFRDYHFAAMSVLADGLADLGVLPIPADDDKGADSRLYRRWTIHSAGHMLGSDVHDCSAARRERYVGGTLAAGMVLTVEPGLYFQPDDLLVPPELRGIGVRIEDNVLVTDEGARVLSDAIPRTVGDVESWVAGTLADHRVHRPLVCSGPR
jgi:Xaa-Pro aminopeptidase